MGALERYNKRKNDSTDNSERNGSALSRYENNKKYVGVDTSGVNDAYFESYNQAANSFFSSKELQEDSYDQWQALNSQADTIRAWAWQNRDKLGSNYDKIMSATDLSEAGQYWNQFKTAEDYAKEYGSYASYNEMMNADLGALEDEISAMEGRINDLKYVERNGFHFGDNSIHAARKDRKQAEQDVAAKRAYYNEAKNLQAGKAYDEQARLDPEFSNISANGAVIAPNGRRIENWVAYYRDPENYGKTASFKTGHYMDYDQTESLESIAGRQMTDDEFATYNYLLGKGDKKAAAAYLKSLEYQLNQREASSIAANLKGRPIAEVAWAIPTGLDQFGSGINSAISSIAGNDGYITPSSIQMSSGMVREDLSDYGFKVFGSSVGQIAYDTLNTTANMAPSILAATAVNMVAPGAGAYVGAGLMGLSAGGNAYAEALNNGYSKDNARAYGLFVGASEAALQSVLGGISSMAGAANISEEVLIGKANAINNALLRVAAKYGIKIGSETVEEELQNFLEPLFRTIFLGEEYDLPTIEELVQTALVTALSTGALESGGIISSDIGTNKYYKDTYGGSQSELVAEGLELDPQSRYFQRLDEKLHQGKDLTGNEIRNVVTRNERAIRNLGEAEVAVEQAETEAKQIAPETAQNAPKIAQERTEVAAEQTVTKTENKADAESATAEATPTNENVQEQLAQASKDYGKQAKAMVANYIEGQDVAEYSAAFRIAYDMGASGVKLSYVEGMDSYLTASQRKIAYEAGKASQDMRAKTIDKNNQKAASGGTVRKKGAVRGDGVSIDDLTKRFNDTQRSAYSIMSTIAEVTGIDIVLYKSEADAKGNFTDAQGKYKKSEPGTLYIDINAGLNNIKSAGDLANYTMLRTFSHEFVHFIENWNPVWYNELRRVVFDHIENADELIAREAAESGLPYERASREVIAEALTDILPDSSFIEDLANNHKNIFEKLLEKLKEFVASIKSHFSTLTPNTNKGAQQLKESGKYFEDIVKLYDKVATEAVENYQATVAKVAPEESLMDGMADAQQYAQSLGYNIKQNNFSKMKGMVQIDITDKAGLPTFNPIIIEQASDWEKVKQAIDKREGKTAEKPISDRYRDVQQKHPDSIVLYRNGEFYEVLGENAKVVSGLLELTLTKRPDDARVSDMVGFPYHVLDKYVAKLRKTHSIAIVEADGSVKTMEKSAKSAKKQKKNASTEADFSNAMESVVNDDANPVPSEEIITDGITVTDDNGTQYSRRSMKADIAEGQMFEDLKTYCGWTQEKVDGLKKQLEDLVAYMAPYSDILDMNETYGREGRRYSPYKPNSDPLYTISMDFSTLCSKRLLTQYVIENLQLRENRPMSAEEQMAIRDMLKEYRKVEKGLQVACVMCYVEAARLKSPKQIQKWLDDPATAMRNYFADKNPEFSAYIKKAQEDFKESKGYDRNATKKEMSPKDVSALNKIRPKVRAEYQPSAEEMEIIETAKSLPNGTYLTAGNLADLSEKHPEIYKAYTAFIRTATRSKSLETDEPYYYGDSRRDNGNGIIVSDSFIEAVNRENGMRFSSWSDWRIQHMLDFITAVIDLSVRGAAMHGYTKFADEVRVLGKTGMMFNLSGVAGTQTGLNEDGTLNFSDTESINIDEAIALREEFPETAGLQCIGVSKEHILALLRSDIIDYVIPYHTSGLNATLRRMGDIYGWMDFTSTQHALEDKSIKKESAIDQENWHTEPVFSEFFVGYDTGLDGVEAMRQSADNYIRMCRERGLIPKFNEFANEPGYWKLLIDRKMVNQKTNTLIQQKPVTPEFDFDVIKGIVDKYVKGYDSGLESRALDYIVRNWDSVPARIRDLKKQGSAKAKTTKKAIDQLANETLAAQPTDVQYSRRQQTDQAYMDAVESGDMETAQRMVDEAAREAGYNYHLYHGTNADFTVFDMKKHGGKNGKGEGYGIYLASNREVSAPYGKNLIDSYTRFNRLAEGRKRTLSYAEVKKLVKRSCEMEAQKAVEDGEYDTVAEAIRDTWVSNYVNTYSYASMSQVYSDVAYNLWENNDNDGDLINEIMASSGAHYDYINALNFYETVLTPATGIDGFHYVWGNKDGSGVQNDIYLAFSSNQIKSADPVTYDDDGNVIPLSERFDEAQEDIRYQRRANYAPGLTSGKPGEGMSYEVSVKDYTLKEVANMYHLGNLGAEYDELFNKAYAFCEKASIHFAGVPSVDNKKGGQAHGASFADKIKLNQQWFNRTDVTNERKSKTILHEMLHSSTVYAITAYNEAKEGEILNELPKHIRRSCEEFLQVYEAIRKNPSFDGQYALTSVEEMVAELANHAFVDKLKDTYPSGWHMILQGICNILGINKSFSNYDKLRRAAERILLDPDFELAQGYYESLQSQTASYLDESQYADAYVQEQRRDGRMTDQEVLAYAVDMYESDPSSMSLSDAEKNAFELFKQRLAKLDSLTEQRYEQGQIYRENTFQKGGDRELAQKAHNRMEVLDGQIARASAQLLSVKEKTVLQGVLQKARKVVEQQERARGDEKLKRWRERREEATQKKKYQTRVMAIRKELIDWLLHPLNKDVTKHVNENVKEIVINFLLSIDPASASYLKKGETTQADMKHAEQAKMLKEMLFGDNAPIDYSAYDLPLNFDERLNAHIEVVRQLTEQYGGDKVLGEMSAEQLKQLSVIMANLQTALKNLNRFHSNSTFVHVDDSADNTLRFLKTLKTRFGKKFDRFLNWKNTRSSWIWQRFGEGGKSIEKELRAGQATLARNAKKVIDFAKETFTAKEQKSWSREIVEVTISGDRKVRLSVGMLMGFYELSKREQGRKHILDGGITLEEVDIKPKGEKKERIMGKYARLTEADIELLNSKLTDRQKEVADALQKFMEKVGADWGNYVTLARFGEKAYGEVGYYPITVDPTSVDSNAPVKQQQGADLYRLLNMSFTHELSKNTSGRVMVYNIFDVFSNHMADMAQYNAMALPVLDAIRWLNYKTYEYDGDERRAKDNLRDELRRAFGADAKSNVGYAEDFVTSILKAYNGTEAQGTTEDAWGVGFMHKFNRAQIAYNLRVVVQQPMSVIRAAMVINPKYLIKALKALDPAKLKENINEMLENSGIALWKDLGYYDINISRGLTQMVKQEEGVFDKVTGWGMKPAEWADKVSWLIMWNAAKLEMADKGVTDLSKVSDAFDEIIYKTQVVDSVLTKTQYMRDKGFFARTSAAFMSEPVATASMALGVFDEIRMDMAQGATFRQAFGNHKGDVARVLIVYAVSSVMLAAVQSIVDAWRDDDEYEDFGEKWLEAFAGNFFDEATPLNKIPIISYVWDVAKIGVDTFTDLDVYGNIPGSALTQWVESLVKLMEIVEEQINGESNYTLFADIYKVLQLAGMSGLPIAPMYREFVAFWNNVIGIMAPSMKIKNYELKEETEIKYAVMDGYLTADEAADELMKQELVYDREEAELTAELWAFLKDHKEYSDVSVSAYAKYKENCEGIDFGYFYQAWKYYSQTDADRDKDGEPISGSKKRKVLDFIYQMRLTPAQKKQLIKCFYK